MIINNCFGFNIKIYFTKTFYIVSFEFDNVIFWRVVFKLTYWTIHDLSLTISGNPGYYLHLTTSDLANEMSRPRSFNEIGTLKLLLQISSTNWYVFSLCTFLLSGHGTLWKRGLCAWYIALGDEVYCQDHNMGFVIHWSLHIVVLL